MVRRLILLLGLLLLALAVHGQARHFDFITMDDRLFILENPHLVHGFTRDSIRWALGAKLLFDDPHLDYWQPVTALSRLLDVELFGFHAGGHHWTNVVLHAANVLLLYMLLLRLTGQAGPSLFVAALFAVHPLHAFSVAWVSARKDLLSLFFGLVAISAWCDIWKNEGKAGGGGRREEESLARQGPYPPPARRPPPYLRARRFSFGLALVAFSLSLMSKPLTLLLPAIMLLLLVWPLGLVADPFSWRAWRRPLLLSLPFWALSLASAGITLLSQSLSPAAPEPAIVLGNIARTLAVYPLRALLPLELACFHPYPRAPLPAMQIAAAILFLALVTWLGLRLRRTHPCIAVGWGWYLAGIAPTLGVGQEANANRFTYLGLIGVFILVAWGWRGLAAASDRLKRATPAIAAFILAAAAILGHREVGYWRDTGTLFGRALAVTGRNHVAAFHLGGILAEAGRFAEAEARFQDVIRWNPDFAPAWHFKGALAEEAGETEAAIGFYRRALEAAPRFRPSARRLEEILGPGPVLY